MLEKAEDEKQKSEPSEVKKEKETPSPEAKTRNAFEAVKEFPVNIFNKVKLFSTSSYQKIFRRLPTKTEENSTPTPTLTPTSTPTPTPTPTGSPTKEEKLDVLVRVLNGGARIGAAGEFVGVLKNVGFTNALADNADNTDYKNATLRYRPENKR